MRPLLTATALIALAAAPALAEDRALILGVERYDDLPRLTGGADVTDFAATLGQRGVRVLARPNPDRGEAVTLAEQFARDLDRDDRLLVSVTGRVATDGTRSWILTADADDPTLIGVDRAALSIDSLLLALSAAPGHAVLMVGHDNEDDEEYDDWLSAGLGNPQIPQGVTVITGRVDAVADLTETIARTSGVNVVAEARRNSRLRVQGYAPASLALFGQAQAAAPAPAPFSVSPTALERDDWLRAQRTDTAQSYSAYLDAYPNGAFAGAATDALNAIRSEPNRAARIAEDALRLDDASRRAIQRNLAVLNFDTRGIDGIFGPGTRNAITNWQQENGFSQTGYLTSEQIGRLNGQAGLRRQQLEAEAARQRAEEELRDRAFWNDTGAGGGEAGLRAYLERFPDGIFADRAEAALGEIEQSKRQAARAEDRDDWDRARNADNRNAYLSYLERQPDGRFREEAQSRIAALQAAEAANAGQQAAQATEQSLGLDPIAMRLVEARLQQLGLEPGGVDGNFNGDTRRAIRRYQRDSGLERTGFLDQQTVSRLITDVFR